MEYKIPNTEIYSTTEWHKTRPMTDHISMLRDSMRLFIACGLATWFSKFHDIKTIGDFGCGNGGLLRLLKHNIPDKTIYGYDLMPENVVHAQKQGLDARYKNIATEEIEYPDLIIMVEVLEHLENPREFLNRVPSGKFIIATVPSWETPKHFSEGHRWIFRDDEFYKMFEECGFEIMEKGVIQLIQIVIARKK